MSMVAGHAVGVVGWSVEESLAAGVERSRVVVGARVSGVSSFGETTPPPAEGEPARAEVRLSLFLTGEELVGALWDCGLFWELVTQGGIDSAMVRYLAMTQLVMLGGPEGPGVDALTDRAYREAAEREESLAEFETVRGAVFRAFGVMAKAAR